MTNTFMESRIGRAYFLPLREYEEGNDQAVNGDPFRETHEDQCTTEGLRLFGCGAHSSSTGTAHRDTRADARQTCGQSRRKCCILIYSAFLGGTRRENRGR